jgi:aminoglycoside phosphotransferase (APT) family kinase protein
MNNDSLSKYLKEKNISDGVTTIEVISEGISSNVYKVGLEEKKSIILKCPSFRKNAGNVFGLKRVKWQHDVQEYLSSSFPVPRPILYCLDRSIVGRPFYLMEEVIGTQKHDEKSVDQSFSLLFQLQQIDIENFLINNPYTKTSINKFVHRLFSQYESIKTGGEADRVVSWLKKNIPQEESYSFVHNDWKMSNILFSSKEVSGVLDWELSEISDPRIDFGIAMAYWPEDDWISIESPYEKIKQTLVDEYFKKNKLDEDSWKFFEVLGIFRLIWIGKLIEHKYRQGILMNDDYRQVYDRIYIAINRCERIIGLI